WSQIPFARTLMIPLSNWSEKNILYNGFDTNDIPKLIDLAKESGRIQFYLTANPTAFVGLEHLEPIFRELRPPSSMHLPLEFYADTKSLKRYIDDFVQLCHVRYDGVATKVASDLGEGLELIRARRSTLADHYAILKSLGLS